MTAVLAPVSLLTSTLFFFGWVRSRALFAYFGVDLGLVGFSPADYVLRSVEILFQPILIAGFIAFALFLARLTLTGYLGRSREKSRALVRSAFLVVAVVGAALAVGAVIGWVSALVGAVALGVAAISGYQAHAIGAESLSPRGDRAVGFAVFAVLAVVASAFWSAAIVAERSGRELAEAFADGRVPRSEVLLYSRSRLALPAEEFTGLAGVESDKPYLYVYRDLRLLTFSGQRWFLIPKDWGSGSATVILRDDDSIRLELVG
ncbi:hypothetical protein [Actinokineospora alba]|uniref:hypothetical protein n=1 Tax=Actinokineospora alba TaxID=504798 RepID=UPI00105C202A|nr:hypothetical protein [Actinokineospora alba]